MPTSSDGSIDEIILCDGCNAEAHMKCLGLSAVSRRSYLMIVTC